MTAPRDETSEARLPPVVIAYSPVSVWTYPNVLLRRWRLVLGVPLAAAAVTAAFLLLSPREYTAYASFVPQEPTSVQGGLGQLASQLGLAAARVSVGSPQFYADFLRSREVLRDVVMTHYEGLGGETLLTYFRVRQRPGNRPILEGMKQLDKISSVRMDRLTGVVKLEVYTTNQALSEEVANRFIQLVNDYNLRRRQSQARAEREFVEDRVGQAKIELSNAEDSLATFLGHNRSFQGSPELVAREARLQRQVTLRQQLYVTLAQNYEAARLDEVRSTPVITVVENPEGLVAPKPRGTIVKTFLALFLGLLLSCGMAYAGDYWSRARVDAPADYGEFVALRHAVASELRRLLLRGNAR